MKTLSIRSAGAAVMLMLAAAGCSERSAADDCEDCPITLTEVATIGRADEDGGPSERSLVALGPKGLYLAPSYDRTAIPFYGPNGERAGMLGREGGAPGEFTGPLLAVMATADSVDVIDIVASRWTKFDRDHKVARTVQVPFPELGTWYAALNDGRIAIAGVTRPGAGSNKPLHFVSADGSIQSFSPPDPADSTAFHHLAPALDGGLWTVQTGAYKVMKWSASGALERTFSIERPWFLSTPRNERPTTASMLNDRGSSAFALRERPDGLWVVFVRVPEDWKPPTEIPRLDDGSDDLSAINEQKYETVVEVLDPVTGALRASQVMPQRLRFINDTLAFAGSTDEDGVVTLKIYRVALRQ